jgi:large subunit ribosomal protein L37Ae
MASKKSGLGAVKRYGVRYGTTNKVNAAVIEKEQRKRQLCPFCRKAKVKRVSVGIWECGKCMKKFSGAAYFLKQTSVSRAEASEEVAGA